MARTVAVGIQDFSAVMERNYFYVDKTDFIREWWDSGDSVTLVARPRRFGKTLNLSMLERFFSLKYEGDGAVFEGLSIWEDEKYRGLQGTYPVISLSFANVKERDFKTACYRIRQLLMKLFEQNRFLEESSVLSDAEKAYYGRMCAGMSVEEAPMALYQLSDYLCRFYGKKVVILLDEYDTPMQEAYVHGYWEELVFFTRSMFHAAFKANPWLERGMLTGITQISKESMFSDLNHLKVVTATSGKYEEAFGFTEQEVFAALEEFGLGDEKEKVKFWYDGFVFGNHTDIYNPWSILNFLDTGKYGAYWANTSANSLAGKLIQEGGRRLKVSFEKLLAGERMKCPVEEQIVYSQLEQSEAAVWGLLVAGGYLKVLGYERMDEAKACGSPMYELALTNNETKSMFYTMVQGWFARVDSDYSDFIQALLMGDVWAMNEYMNRVALGTFSFFDKNGREPERFYHGFVLGLIVELEGRYLVRSNRESGFGRYDVMLMPREPGKDDGIILEFKVHNFRQEGSMQETAKAALLQIKEKRYEEELLECGLPPERIQMYGFAFRGKEVWIERAGGGG